MHSPDAPFARLEPAREELAKAWLQGIIDRAPLDEVAQLPIGDLAQAAPGLIGEILREAGGASPDPGAASGARERVVELSRMRRPPEAFHRDLAALQVLLISALTRELHEREGLARAAERLAESFGSIHAALEGPAQGPAAEPAPGALAGGAELHDWLARLVAGYRRYGHPFAVLSIDIEGLRRVNDAYGGDAGDRALEALAATLEREIRTVDHAFRYTDDDFCVLAPLHDAAGVVALAERLRSSLADSLRSGATPVSLAVGIASCPENGESAVQLLDAAQEATYAAKAEGRGVAISAGIRISPGENSSLRRP